MNALQQAKTSARRTAVLRQLSTSVLRAPPESGRANCGAISSIYVVNGLDPISPLGDQQVRAATAAGAHFTGHGEYFAPLIDGQRRGNQGTAFSPSLRPPPHPATSR